MSHCNVPSPAAVHPVSLSDVVELSASGPMALPSTSTGRASYWSIVAPPLSGVVHDTVAVMVGTSSSLNSLLSVYAAVGDPGAFGTVRGVTVTSADSVPSTSSSSMVLPRFAPGSFQRAATLTEYCTPFTRSSLPLPSTSVVTVHACASPA